MAQFARPSSDVATGNWSPSTGATLYGCIDETSAADGDWIESDSKNTGTCEVGLGTVTDPTSSSNHVVRYRLRRERANKGNTVVVTLKCGGTDIAAWTEADPSDTFTTSAKTLTGTQADNITDYSDLRLEFDCTVNGGISMEVSWAEFEVPEVAGTTYYQSCDGTLDLSGGANKGTETTQEGTLPLSGALSRATSTALAGTLGLAGALARTIEKSADGTLGLSGTVATQLVSIQSGSGTLGLSGTLDALAEKLNEGALGLSGALTRKTATTNAGTLGLAGAVSRAIDKVLSGTLGLSGTTDTALQLSEGVAGTLDLSGALATSYTGGGGGGDAVAHTHWTWGGWD